MATLPFEMNHRWMFARKPYEEAQGLEAVCTGRNKELISATGWKRWKHIFSKAAVADLVVCGTTVASEFALVLTAPEGTGTVA
jgi:hypothetical protein